MALHWPTFLTRTGSAVVFAVVMLAGLLWTPWAFGVLIITITPLCLADYFRLMERVLQTPIFRTIRVATSIGVALILTALWLDLFHDTLPKRPDIGEPGEDFYWLFSPLLVCIPTLLLLTALAKRGTVQASLAAAGGLVYIALPAAMLIGIYEIDRLWPLVLILCIWTNDTMAYIVGSLIGRTPFSPISPKKTWEGTAGGAILTVAGAATWAYFSEEVSARDVTAVALCAAVFGTLGDLFESKLKRLAGVKDSGTLMPGHGGALDRFDSLLVATPFAFCYLYFTHL